MIKWIIIAAVAIVLIMLFVLAGVLSKKRGKKNLQKLDDTIKKFKSEKDVLVAKEQADEDRKKEEEAFANITLTDDVEDEFADLFGKNAEPVIPSLDPDFDGGNKNNFDELFFPEELQKPKQSKPRNRDREFDDFLNEHSYTRRVFDGDLLNQIQSLPPKIKAIVLGNLFNKFED